MLRLNLQQQTLKSFTCESIKLLTKAIYSMEMQRKICFYFWVMESQTQLRPFMNCRTYFRSLEFWIMSYIFRDAPKQLLQNVGIPIRGNKQIDLLTYQLCFLSEIKLKHTKSNSNLSMLTKTLTQILNKTLYTFSTQGLNIRVPLFDPLTQKPNDQYIHRYNNKMFEAYLTKRRLGRSQIWPKIHILDGVPKQEQRHLEYQGLHEIRRMMDEDLLARIVKEDPSQINTAFIISLFGEDHLKPILDQYLKKVLVCGKAPQSENQAAMNEVQAQAKALYRNFYFGEKLTFLQREIQLYYLATKQEKSRYTQKQLKNFNNKHLYFCRWTEQDQRLIEDIVNWPVIDLNLSDITYRPYYEPLRIQSRRPHALKFFSLIGGKPNQTSNIKPLAAYSYGHEYLQWIRDKIFSRTIQYTKCLEFTDFMRIPPDFSIQLSILNIHIWMIISRLQQFDSKTSKNLVIYLIKFFDKYLESVLIGLNVKRISTMQKNYEQNLKQARNVLNMHFYGYTQTSANPYLSIDALVWSVAFREKVQRYSDQVYMFSEYFVKNWQNLKNYSQQDLLDAICEFDCYLYEPDYKQKIMAINPPLSKQQFQLQFKSNKEKKKYYYSFTTEKFVFDFDTQYNKSVKTDNYSFLTALLNKLAKIRRKYLINLDTYDHFAEMQKQEKQEKLKQETSPWKTNTDKIKEIEREFGDVREIRRRRGSGSNMVDQE